MHTAAKFVMAHSSSAAAAAEEAPACSSLSIFDLASSHHPPDAAFCLILRGGTSRELGRGRKRNLKEESPPRSKKRPAWARRWWESTRYGDWRIRPPWWVLRPPRLVSPLLRTAATAVPTLSRETEVGKSVITDHMTSVGWRVPDRLTQEAALRGSSVAAPFDILVIGGGATGCGVALDAATRGLRVGLVERDDYSAGTSSRSIKLVHGGVRCLEKAFWQFDYGQLKLVFHALEERAHILQNAPQLCNALPTMTPCYEWWEIPYYWAGLKLYDLVAGSHMLYTSRYFSKMEAMETFPTLVQQNAL